ncbi:MAG: VanZ family protein [Planctomycetes bacterium]|nr:VanZ family protein [Planctomycetota bacterium]
MTFDPHTLLRYSRKAYLLVAVLYMGGIYFLSGLSIPFKDTPHPDLLAFCANLFHLPLYTGLGLVLLLGYRDAEAEQGSWFVKRTVFLALSTLALYGAFDEFHQSWSGRTPSVLDFFVDLCGGSFAVCVLKFFIEKTLSQRGLILSTTIIFVLAGVFAFAGMF